MPNFNVSFFLLNYFPAMLVCDITMSNLKMIFKSKMKRKNEKSFSILLLLVVFCFKMYISS